MPSVLLSTQPQRPAPRPQLASEYDVPTRPHLYHVAPPTQQHTAPYHRYTKPPLSHLTSWQTPPHFRPQPVTTPPTSTMPPINPDALSSFTNSTAYDSHRPTYPPASIQHLLAQCRVAGKRGARVVDLAAGTGKFTEALAAREEEFEILAVEPHADMRAVLEAKGLRGVRVVDGTAEEMGVEEGWADAVFVAQVGLSYSSNS